MSDVTYIPKPNKRMGLPEVPAAPVKPKKARDPKVISRVAKHYDEMQYWGSFTLTRPKFSAEEKACLKALYDAHMRGEFNEADAITKFRETFAFRSRGSVRWRLRKMKGLT